MFTCARPPGRRRRRIETVDAARYSGGGHQADEENTGTATSERVERIQRALRHEIGGSAKM
jgi:hypothetical protein